MAKLREPNSMEECIYFTNRSIGEQFNGTARCWVFKEMCPKCKKSLMGKPRKDDGKVSIRAKEYVCPSCNFTMEKLEYEATLTANIEYKCPGCGFEGQHQMPFKRKKVMGVETLRFPCAKCKENIDVTKKMKTIKKKGKVVEDVDGDEI
jgi:predicted RNA-binding Zn-ribbon protein involved in translation (DUF1610 family)